MWRKTKTKISVSGSENYPNLFFKKTKTIGIVVIFLELFYAIFLFYYHLYLTLLFLSISVLSLWPLLFVTEKKSSKIAKHIALIIHHIAIILWSFSLGRDAETYIFFLPFFILIPYFIEDDEINRKEAILYECFSIFCLIFILIFCPDRTSWQTIDDRTINFLSYFNIFLCCIMVTAIVLGKMYWKRIFAKELFLKKEMEQNVMADRSHFLAKMSHELRTPLNGIIGVKYILEQEHKVESKYLETLENCSVQMLNLVNQFLDLNKIQNNKLELHRQSFNVKKIIQKSHLPFLETAKAKGVALKNFVDPDLDIFVNGDGEKLIQVINNLLNNAIKFTSSGTILLDTKIVNVLHKKVEIQFAITDTGAGIDQSNLEDIFKEFWQVYSNTAKKYEGTGLGLSISQKLLELMGSKLQVESKLGKGSRFFFNIFFDKVPMLSENQNKPSPASIFSGLRVLVADDNLINLMLILNILRVKNIVVFSAENGEEALAVLNTEIVDLVFMDLEMPVMDGYTACSIIKETHADIPVIACTASIINKEKNTKLSSLGFKDFITKPFAPKEMLDKIEKYTYVGMHDY